jgi:hypothetical protein
MKIRIKTMMNIPELPSEVETEGGDLRGLFLKIFSGVHFAHHVIDRTTGEIKADGVFEIRLNNVPYYALPHGMETEFHDGDEIELSLITLGGG